MSVAIEVRDISKQFRLYNEKHTSLKERVIHGGKMPFTPFWALPRRQRRRSTKGRRSASSAVTDAASRRCSNASPGS